MIHQKIANLISGHPRVSSLGLFAGLSLAVLFSGIARVAETPAAGASGRLDRIAPGSLGEVRFQLAKIGMDRVDVDPATAQIALRGVPLASDPLAALAARGLADDPRGSSGKEAALLAEALRRDPRSRPARILLLRQMAANGNLKGAFDQLAVFSRLNPGLVEAIMEAITARVGTVRQVDDALSAIAGHDGLYLPFVNRMVGKRKPPEVVLHMAQKLPAAVIAKPEIRRSVVRQLVDAGLFSDARRLWQQGLPNAGVRLVHSPDFADRAAPPPFNWQLYVGPTGAAERARNGGLSIAYYDRNPGLLATQLLTLVPGSYQAMADYEVISGTPDNVRLRIVCQGNGTVLGEAGLVQRKPGLNRLSLNFSVPGNGCNGQMLAVAGVATEERGEKHLLVKRIDVVAGGSK
ncbi:MULTISPECIES: hypothetical protein [unclassified Novosphingobium]|uniref:hypothetical protein n=1 Tax=unclassified Novosphingobium TaxID=2644732 RepID=UPI0025ED808C|nr:MULTISPECIES: hypothetical protein [unclassified Novosphingobium]HQV02566.1 hypothetical protein [Novosphingobium sp.]